MPDESIASSDEENEIFRKEYVLLCEGNSDRFFFRSLLYHHEIETFQITNPAKGRGGFHRRLRAIRGSDGFSNIKSILIVSDNDNPSSSFEEVRRDILQAERYGVPNRPLVPAITSNHPSIVIMMLPRDSAGCLETLILEAAIANWPDMRDCLENFKSCSPARDWSTGKQAKMLLQSLVAAVCKEDPLCSLSFLWNRDDFKPLLNHVSFNEIVNFLASYPDWLTANS